MSYQVHNFQTGEVIEAAPVNEMDAQIQQNEQDISGKADKVTGATSGHLAGLDANGNLTDSGNAPGDFALKTDTVLLTTLSRGRKANTTVGTASLAFGNNVEASGSHSQAVGNGTKASGAYSSAEGYSTTASAQATHTEGKSTTASSNYGHAEGYNSTASGESGHAEGNASTASGNSSHAQNRNTTASGEASSASGYYSSATGKWSSANGNHTTANHRSQMTFGEFNTPDLSEASATDRGTYVEIVGNGTSALLQSNARTLDWDGNERLKGTLYVGCNDDSTGGAEVATKFITEAVTGTTPSITGVDNHKYVCGEVSTLSITAPQTGIIDVTFQSGTTATVLTTSGITWPAWFDSTDLEASATYEINVQDGLGAVMVWT